ncbi:MAG: S-layer homology domain-containing protein [Firmicutes bacterium]|nr:S-layer homology domain-containing protein [Bacillota bacterium]
MDIIASQTSINISGSGKGCQMRLGDIDGDGRLEIVLIKPDAVSDERYFPHQVVCATAFNLEGEVLWQIGDPEYESEYTDSDIPAQIYDIDKDGKNELIAVMNGELCIFDGKTAELKKKVDLPSKYAHDCIIIADLEGKGYAQNIILKNKFSRMWAFDINLNVLWSFQGNIGHCPVACDINGDGIDEIIAGYNVLSGSGELLWKINMPSHANSICVGDLYSNGEMVIIICGPETRAYSTDGKLLWAMEETAENIAMGSFRSRIKEKDLLILDNLSLFDAYGNFVFQKNEIVYFPTPINNFDGLGNFYIAGHKKEDICTTLYDGYMRACYTLPTFGSICCGDLLGDGISQVIIYTDDTADIYSLKDINLHTAYRPYPRPQSRLFFNVSSHNTPPLSESTSNYLIEDYALQNTLKWADTYATLNIHNTNKITRAEFVLLFASLLNLKEDVRDNFSDVAKGSQYYESVGTLRKLGIIEGENNLFHPDSPILVSDANEILTKLSIPLTFTPDGSRDLTKQDVARFIAKLNI